MTVFLKTVLSHIHGHKQKKLTLFQTQMSLEMQDQLNAT